MKQQLLSRNEAAEVLGISTSTLDRRVREGQLKPVKGHKTPKFNVYDVMQLAGTDTSKLSPFERRKLLEKIGELEEQNERLENEIRGVRRQLTSVVAEIMPILREG